MAKVISLINMKGGVAKTTCAVNIAHCLSKRHKQRVLLIDIDPQFNATQCTLSPDEYVAHLTQKKDTIISVFDRGNYPVIGIVNGSTINEPKKLEDIKPVTLKSGFDLFILCGGG